MDEQESKTKLTSEKTAKLTVEFFMGEQPLTEEQRDKLSKRISQLLTDQGISRDPNKLEIRVGEIQESGINWQMITNLSFVVITVLLALVLWLLSR